MTAERIVLLGAGRLATHLSRALKAYAPERRIVQIYSLEGIRLDGWLRASGAMCR